MKKFIAISVILIFSSCHSFNQLSFDEDLTTKINLQYKTEKKPIDLTEITDFEWDNYIVIGCYQIPEQVGKKYNIDLSNISEYATANDWNSLLVFIKSKKSIKICDVKRSTEFSEKKLLKVK
ncbi:hypothetical protein [Flavobacterium sp. LB3R33]|uniref:hypothetical protein n=1 Tax=Flavobacterium sp. LB3R33 TaxID=3401721 RepID=UPI003AAD4CC0